MSIHWVRDDDPVRRRFTMYCENCDTKSFENLTYNEAVKALHAKGKPLGDEARVKCSCGNCDYCKTRKIRGDGMDSNDYTSQRATSSQRRTKQRFNKAQRMEVIEKATQRRYKILDKKGNDYKGDTQNANENFYRNAEALGQSPFAIWAVYYNKHHDSLMTWVRTGKMESEGIESRLDDMRNYLDILEAILYEENIL